MTKITADTIEANRAALKAFSQKYRDSQTKTSVNVPSELETLLAHFQRTGKLYNEWVDLKILIASKLRQTLEHANTQVPYSANTSSPNAPTFESRRDKLLALLYAYDGAPFTTQRLLELILEPSKNYRSTTKLMNGMEKLLTVSSVLPQSDVNGNPIGGLEDVEETPDEETLTASDLPPPENPAGSLPSPVSVGASFDSVVAQAPWMNNPQ